MAKGSVLAKVKVFITALIEHIFDSNLPSLPPRRAAGNGGEGSRLASGGRKGTLRMTTENPDSPKETTEIEADMTKVELQTLTVSLATTTATNGSERTRLLELAPPSEIITAANTRKSSMSGLETTF